MVGLEPTTFSLEGKRATNCATQVLFTPILLELSIFLVNKN